MVPAGISHRYILSESCDINDRQRKSARWDETASVRRFPISQWMVTVQHTWNPISNGAYLCIKCNLGSWSATLTFDHNTKSTLNHITNETPIRIPSFSIHSGLDTDAIVNPHLVLCWQGDMCMNRPNRAGCTFIAQAGRVSNMCDKWSLYINLLGALLMRFTKVSVEINYSGVGW